MINLIENTPVERWDLGSQYVWVKREDLCSPPPAPPFSKVRGVYRHLKDLKRMGITDIGYVETDISMAGIAVAWACRELNMTCYIFYPEHKGPLTENSGLLFKHMLQWTRLDAKLTPIKPGRAKVNYHICVKENPNIYFLPLGLPLRESVLETAKEFQRTPGQWATVVVAVGSGTICTGILAGMSSGHLIGVMCRSGDAATKRKKIWAKSGKSPMLVPIKFDLIDPGYEYMDHVDEEFPFPTHPYYDAKAALWLKDHLQELEHPVLFWNIGKSV